MQMPQKTRVRSLVRKEIATHSSILAWEISWTEDPARLQSVGSQRVRHDLATKTLSPPPFPHNPAPGNHHCPLCFYEFDFFFFIPYLSEIIQCMPYSSGLFHLAQGPPASCMLSQMNLSIKEKEILPPQIILNLLSPGSI